MTHESIIRTWGEDPVTSISLWRWICDPCELCFLTEKDAEEHAREHETSMQKTLELEKS
ncbi:MAG: hypothetical protein V3U54_13185 [Thermodesulfobacteriota bacterium]